MLGENIIYEIDRGTGDILWSVETSDWNYDADVIYLHEPEAHILLPYNTDFFFVRLLGNLHIICEALYDKKIGQVCE